MSFEFASQTEHNTESELEWHDDCNILVQKKKTKSKVHLLLQRSLIDDFRVARCC